MEQKKRRHSDYIREEDFSPGKPRTPLSEDFINMEAIKDEASERLQQAAHQLDEWNGLLYEHAPEAFTRRVIEMLTDALDDVRDLQRIAIEKAINSEGMKKAPAARAAGVTDKTVAQWAANPLQEWSQSRPIAVKKFGAF